MSGEPKSKMLPDESLQDFGAAMGQAFNIILTGYGHENIFRSCYRCKHWIESPFSTGCGVYHQLPPVRIIVVGCDSFEDRLGYVDSDIPF
jgi:hypothetical protein